MRRLLALLAACLMAWIGWWLGATSIPAPRPPRADRAIRAQPVVTPAPALPAQDRPADTRPADAPALTPRGTTWLVLRVDPQGSDVVTRVHKDALPYHVVGSIGATRFRLLESGGAETTGPCDWPRLCPCDRATSHTRGCVRAPHSGSVRLRLPRLHGSATVLIERRGPSGWEPLDRFEVDA